MTGCQSKFRSSAPAWRYDERRSSPDGEMPASRYRILTWLSAPSPSLRPCPHTGGQVLRNRTTHDRAPYVLVGVDPASREGVVVDIAPQGLGQRPVRRVLAHLDPLWTEHQVQDPPDV